MCLKNVKASTSVALAAEAAGDGQEEIAVAMKRDVGEEHEGEPTRAEATGEHNIKIFAVENLIMFFENMFKKAWLCLLLHTHARPVFLVSWVVYTVEESFLSDRASHTEYRDKVDWCAVCPCLFCFGCLVM